MSSPVSQAREDTPQETTPLLQRSSIDNEEQPRDSDDDSETESSSSWRHHKVLFIGTIISLVFATAGLTLLIITTWMGFLARSTYGYYEDWPLMQLTWRILFASIAAIPLAVTNLVRLRCDGVPLPFMINSVFLGFTGLVGLYLGVSAIVIRLSDWGTPRYCRDDLHDPENPWYDGSYEECLHWVSIYGPMVYTWLAILCVYSCVQIVLFVQICVDYYRARTKEGGTGTEGTFTFPVGGLSVEFRINWGNRQNQEAIEPQTQEVERQA